MHRRGLLVLALILVAPACEREGVRSYTVAKPAAPRTPDPQPAPTTGAKWPLPQGWTLVPGQKPMRLATFNAPAAGATIEVSLTEFPGETGGLLANINRWRTQAGLSAITEPDLAGAGAQSQVGPVNVYLTRLRGTSSDTLGAVLFHTTRNQSRFIKATTTPAQADALEPSFNDFAANIAQQWGTP